MEFVHQKIQSEFNELSNNFPLHYACKEGNSNIVNSLLESNLNLSIIEDEVCGWTPVHWAAYFGKLDCMRNVVAHLPWALDIQTSKRFCTPAHCAADAGHPHCLLWLLQAGANANMKDVTGEVPLHKCSRNGSAECVSLLIESACDLRITNNLGETAATVAERNGHQAIADYIHQAEMAQALGSRPGGITRGSIRMYMPNGNPTNFVSRLSKKRSFDAANDHTAKRTCTIRNINEVEVSSPAVPTVQQSVVTAMDSEVEYENLCTVDRQYADSMFLECFFSQHRGF